MKADLIDSICGGLGKRFKGACAYYDSLTRECRLLREGRIKDLLEQETKKNCDPFDMIQKAIDKHLKGEDEKAEKNYISGLVHDKLRRLGKLTEAYNLPVLREYINTTSEREVRAFLKKTCGDCVYLSLSKPHICEKEDEPNPYHKEKRNPSDKACNGLKKFTEEPISATDSTDENEYSVTIPDDKSNEIFSKLEVRNMMKLLADRIKEGETEAKKKQYERQHTVLIKLRQLIIDEDSSLTDAIESIAEKIGKNEKTVRRDLKEIRNFLSDNS